MKLLRVVLIILIMVVAIIRPGLAQDNRSPIYDPGANARQQISDAVTAARKENKYVFMQIGGNWCSWCYLFNDFIHNDSGVDSLIRENFIPVHINYSKENYNKPVLASLEYPQRFGFPVFVILDKSGREIHIQDSGLLEEGHGYNRDKVMGFLQNWAPSSLDPDKYK